VEKCTRTAKGRKASEKSAVQKKRKVQTKDLKACKKIRNTCCSTKLKCAKLLKSEQKAE
jgi:hypothetical protein